MKALTFHTTLNSSVLNAKALLVVSLLLLFATAVGQTRKPSTDGLANATPTQLPTPVSPPLEQQFSALASKVAELSKKVDNPPKDNWDRLTALSGLITGGLVTLIGIFATRTYSRRQIAAEEAKTVQSFMPQLQSKDERDVEAALLAIAALGNSKLATGLASLYRSKGAISALSKIALSTNQKTAELAERSLEKQFSALKASVVYIGSKRKGGCGFIVDSNGYIVTADFVVGGAKEVQVTLGDEHFSAKVIHRDEEHMLALLKISDQRLTPLPITSEHSVKATDQIFILGWNPKWGWKFNVGQVTGMRVQQGDDTDQYFISAEIETWPGYAGSPAINQKGEVIGVHVMKERQLGTLLVPSSKITSLLNRRYY
jgi:S1-C subfamily serine protease